MTHYGWLDHFHKDMSRDTFATSIGSMCLVVRSSGVHGAFFRVDPTLRISRNGASEPSRTGSRAADCYSYILERIDD